MARTKTLTRTAAADLSLVGDLAARLNRSAKELVKLTVRSEKDPRRLFTSKQRRQLCEREGGCCFYCGTSTPLDSGVADHVVPHAKGGRTILLNGAWACKACNSAKSDKVW